MGDRARFLQDSVTAGVVDTYDPPRIDSYYTNWEQHYPETWAELRDLAAGIGVTRPAVIRLDPALEYEAPRTGNTHVITVQPADDQENGWLYIMPLEASYAQIAPEGTRIDPSTHGAHMPTIQAGAANTATLQVAPLTRYVRLIGLDITHSPETKTSSGICYLGREKNGVNPVGSPDDESEWAQDIVADRCYCHGPDSQWSRDYTEGFVLIGRRVALIESYVNYIRKADEARSVYVPYASRGITVWNNYIGSTGIGFFTGGTRNLWVGSQYEDIDVRYNDMVKDPEFNPLAPEYVGVTRSCKNHTELKGGQRVYIAFNRMRDQFRLTSSQGRAITLKNSEQTGNYWQELVDILIEYNDVRHNPKAFSLSIVGSNGPIERITIRNNLFVSSNHDDPYPLQMLWSGYSTAPKQIKNVHFLNNTFVARLNVEPESSARNLASIQINPVEGHRAMSDLRLVNNVLDGGIHGIKMSGTASGDASLNKYADSWEVADIIAFNCDGEDIASAGVTELASIGDVGFAQTTDPYGSWHISGEYEGYGCNYNELMTRTTIARTGVRF